MASVVRAARPGAYRRNPLQAGLAALVLAVFVLSLVLSLWFTTAEAMRKYGGVGVGTAAGAFPLAAVDSAASLLRSDVARRVYPGAVLAAGIGERTLVLRGTGRLVWSVSAAAASPVSTLYDLASLSKAVATTTAVLLLVQDGRIRLDDPVQRWLPGFSGRWKEQVTWRHLLTHTAGLPPAGHMRGSTSAQRLASLLRTRLEARPGAEVQYSDVGYVTLWAAAEHVAGEPLPRFLARRVWRPLGMSSTGYLPGEGCVRCAPTLMLNSGAPFRGKPSDPMARKLGGIAGNAGLFSTAADLGRFAAMVASGGILNGVRILRPDLARALVTQQPRAGRRTLGWDAFCPAEPAVAGLPCLHPIAYGHYGWTGTSLWVDPARGLWVVLLANRSYDVIKPKPMDSVRQGVFAALEGTGAATVGVSLATDSAADDAGALPGRSLLAQQPPLHAPVAAPLEAYPGR